jgi:CheY-like chemotaxis protein
MSVLQGKKILVVEDEPLVALMVAEMLRDAGCIVIGPAYDVATALTYFQTEQPDAAVLDFNLGRNGTSAPVADALASAGVPFIYATGYGESALRKQDRSRLRIDKPFEQHLLFRNLALCLSQNGGSNDN